jgi:hypothetical protein
MRHLQIITNSEVEDFRRCHAYWGFRYPEGLRPLEEVPSKGFGSLYHQGAASGWRAAWCEQELSIESRRERAIAASVETVGKAVAANREEVAKAWTGEQDALDELVAELDEHREIAFWALPNYFTRQASDLRMVPVAIEAPFDVPIPDVRGLPHVLRQQGVLDLVLWDRDAGLVFVQDHKTSGYGVDTMAKRLPLDTQMSGYIRAVDWVTRRIANTGLISVWSSFTTPAADELVRNHAADVASAGMGPIMINFARRARPARPKVNKFSLPAKMRALPSNAHLTALYDAQEADGIARGEVSVALLDTTAEVYSEALLTQVTERHQPITDKQREFLESLRGKPDTFFQQLEFYRGPEELERWRQEMWVEAARIRAATKDPKLRTRNPHACAGPTSPKCVYAEVCMSPDSPEARARFRVATDRHEEVRDAHGASGHRQADDERPRDHSRISPAAFDF